MNDYSINFCPCGRNKNYSDCCEPIHKDITKANTAEDLMRSRYTAFTLANTNYLLKSWSSKTVDTSIAAKKELTLWAKSVIWERLEVLKTTKGTASNTTGTVEFKAYFYEAGILECIHEKSFFEKENGYWVYVSEA